jgi:type IV pilus assembly protein PilY1
MKQHLLALPLLVLSASAGDAIAQSSLSCPTVSGDTSFSGTSLQTECSETNDTTCTTKSGINYDATTSVLKLPGSAGNFQGPPSAAVSANVYFAAPGDYDRDGWTDVAAADNTDKIYILRNQTITCGTTSCSGSTSVAPTVQTIAASWWNTLSNKRPAAFRTTTTTGGTALPLKAGVSASQRMSPMAAGDFDGDGWTDFVQISATYCASGCSGNDVASWPTAARLFLNTKNCRLTSQSSNFTPCGIGNLCTGQPANGACSGGSVTNGTPYTETQLSCTRTDRCPYYMPTFATYDLLTGAAESDAVGTTTTPTTTTPGNFGPIGHPVQNMVVLDWDGDGDLDFLFGHSGGTCPSGLCGTGFSTFYAGIDVWLNSCAQSAQWNATTKSCEGHIPRFSHAANTSACTASTCNNNQTLIPSTAHNTTTLAPNNHLGFDIAVDGDKRIPGFAYTDIDKDGDRDLVIGSPGCCSSNVAARLRVFRGTTNNKFSHMLDTANPIVLSTSSSNTTYKGFKGQLTAVFVSDFSGDGYPDIITGTDGFASQNQAYDSTLHGRTQYWKNTGNATNPFGTSWPSCSASPATCASCGSSCNPGHTTLLSDSGTNASATANLSVSPPTFGDFDMGLMLDYDHDPNNTLDMVMTNGNLVNEFYLFPNRASTSTVAACGSVASGTLPAPVDESTVSGACITPTASFPNSTSSITYYLTNEDPENYILACKQTQSGIVPSPCCVSFPNITGKTIRWKAVFDSNSSDDATSNPCTATGSASPTMSAVAANYTYSAASEHYRGGVVISDGVTYAGAFRQPGNRGSFYAIAAGDGTRYYDAAEEIDAMSTRWIYTASAVGTSITRLNFNTASASTLTGLLGSSASQIVTWVLSDRFGLGSTLSTVGAVINSTPAVLTPPFRPNWYAYLSSTDKQLYDTFATNHAARPTLALFASMDGMIHAIISPATTIASDPNAGREAWAFIPPNVAAGMSADYIASCPSGTCSSDTLTVTAYPDGSPTLLDYKKSNNTIATVALVGDGAGGKSMTALDVTNTITVSGSGSTASYTRVGPTPMWSQLPGGSAAGKAMSKPGVARVKINGAEKYVVVTGTGIDSADSNKGKIVAGIDLETGELLWQFETSCALTSDITIFETDDTGEPGSPTVDGLADRAVFADYCGYVYKVNPAQDLDGAFMGNSGYGSVSIGTSNGVARYALFTTTATSALGTSGSRPIVGALAAKTGSDGDMVLFFGTGGIESFDASKQNAFFAIYAKNGNIRGSGPNYPEGKILGDCTGSGADTKCEKFYGGVVLTSDTVILQKTRDPVITGEPGGCDFGQSKVQFRNIGSLTQTQEIDSIDGQPIAASSSPLYGDANAIYFATVSGKINRIGSPRASAAGADTTAGNMNQMASGAGVTTYDTPFTLIGWRVVL